MTCTTCERRGEDSWGSEASSQSVSQAKKYVIYVMALDQVFKHGLVLQQIHWVIEFDQSVWLAPYIMFNTQLRTRAKNNLEKDFFKLMNNSVFGKTVENIRKHRDINLVTNEEAYLKRVVKPNFRSGIHLQREPDGVWDGEDQSCNEQTHLPWASHPRYE